MQTPLRFRIKLIGMLFQIADQRCAVRIAFAGITDGIEFQAHILQAKIVP